MHISSQQAKFAESPDRQAGTHAQVELQANERRYRALAAATASVVWSARPDGTVVDAWAWDERTGQSIQQARAGQWIEAIHPDDLPSLLEAWRKGSTAEVEYRAEFRMRAAAGEYRWSVLHAVPIRSEDGTRLVEWVGTVADIHERHLAEQAVRDRDERHMLVAAAVNQAIWELDLRSGEVLWHEGFQELFGYDEGQGLEDHASWLQHIHPEDRDDVTVSFGSLLLGSSDKWDAQYRFQRPDGHYVSVLDRGSVVRNSAGVAIRCVRSMQDLSKWAEVVSHMSFQAGLLNAVEQAVVATDLEGSIIYWNKFAERLYGWSAAEAMGMNVLDATSAAEKDSLVAMETMHKLALGKSWAAEFKARRRDGTVFQAQVTDSPVYDARGRLTAIVGVSQDISERKRAEANLEASESRYRLLADNATDMISRTDLNGIRMYVSPACREILGYAPEQLVGLPMIRHVHPQDAPRIEAQLRELVSGTRDLVACTHRMRTASGGWAVLDVQRRLVRDQSGRPAEVLSIARDVTERTKLEEQLRKAQRLEAVGQLTGGVAHDFNNLLTIIIGNLELLSESLAGHPELGSAAEVALQAAERGAELTAGLLAFARKQPLAPKPLNVQSLVVGMHNLLRRTLGDDIALAFKLHDASPEWQTYVDAAQLEGAILNLCLNARDAMPNGGHITVVVAQESLGSDELGQGETLPVGDYVTVAVGDTGCGMTPEVLDRVFEPFFTTKDVGKGSGLGLSMVYGFIRQSNGYLKIRSEVGQGTEVKLYLPKAATSSALRVEKPLSEPEGEPAHGSILLVEDDASVLALVQKLLTNLGYEVVTASAGAEALQILTASPHFDLLLTDVVMPGGMTGLELSRKARAIRPNLPVLFCSGHTRDTLIHEGKLDEGVNLLGKPYRRSDLAAAVRKALAEGAEHAGPTRSATPELVPQ